MIKMMKSPMCTERVYLVARYGTRCPLRAWIISVAWRLRCKVLMTMLRPLKIFSKTCSSQDENPSKQSTTKKCSCQHPHAPQPPTRPPKSLDQRPDCFKSHPLLPRNTITRCYLCRTIIAVGRQQIGEMAMGEWHQAVTHRINVSRMQVIGIIGRSWKAIITPWENWQLTLQHKTINCNTNKIVAVITIIKTARQAVLLSSQLQTTICINSAPHPAINKKWL